MFHDSADVREVQELRLFPSGTACLETRRLGDFDAKRNAWTTELGVRMDDIDDARAANRAAAAMLAEIAGSLHPSRHNTSKTEFFYPTPDL
ncbi:MULTISPECIES: hypothetical protein [unclassified Variovorax]|uniref:hypothetical protein n=1 Tax=unclassified Variovorax TaxID=663243 RepID=UPI0013186583|nr:MULTISPECIES: hypothetical protein [unclassified Variovorax]VTU41858.1 hypothetical protein H6P1_00060 [Variovorax sp. PBL-H6]VTU44479.1 hypothetical protein SRS16P1_00842 [Variovorax sp. SRS16]VTU44524.1 hypothetical protein E5P1_00835 [Variovorax sp. PBL-E5]